MSSQKVLLIRSGEGVTFDILGIPTVAKFNADDTSGAYLLSEQIVPPGMGVPPHVHTREDEIFFVLDGEVEFLAGERVIIGRAGDIVHAPRDVPHSYRAVGDNPAHMRFVAIPGGLEGMFRELATWPPGPPDMVQLGELCGRYGIRFL